MVKNMVYTQATAKLALIRYTVTQHITVNTQTKIIRYLSKSVFRINKKGIPYGIPFFYCSCVYSTNL